MKKQWLYLSPLAAMLFVTSKCDDDVVSTIELPAVIQNYLNNNYSGYEVEESERDSLCNDTAVYDIELEGPKDKEVELTFDTEGNLLFTETEIKSGDLPTAVTAGINAIYTDAVIKEAVRLDLAGGGAQYEVELKIGPTLLEVLFAADGSVICEQASDDDDGE